MGFPVGVRLPSLAPSYPWWFETAIIPGIDGKILYGLIIVISKRLISRGVILLPINATQSTGASISSSMPMRFSLDANGLTMERSSGSSGISRRGLTHIPCTKPGFPRHIYTEHAGKYLWNRYAHTSLYALLHGLGHSSFHVLCLRKGSKYAPWINIITQDMEHILRRHRSHWYVILRYKDFKTSGGLHHVHTYARVQ